MSEGETVTVRKKAVCPSCGMTIEKGGEMFKSLKMPNKYVCVTCAIRERRETRKQKKN